MNNRQQTTDSRQQTKKHIRAVVCGLWSVVFLAFVATAQAGIAVDPTVIEKSVQPGETVTGSYTVTNRGEDTVIVTIEPVDWMRRYVQKLNTVDVAKWLTFDTYEVELAPAEAKEVGYRATVPYEMQEEQAAQIFFAFKSKEKAQQFRTRLGVIFYLAVKGTERPSALIETINVRPVKNEDGSYNVICRVSISNTGNVHMRPFGSVRITKHSDVVATMDIKRAKGIYAGKSDFVAGMLEGIMLEPGTYAAEVEIECGMYESSNILVAKEYFTL